MPTRNKNAHRCDMACMQPCTDRADKALSTVKNPTAEEIKQKFSGKADPSTVTAMDHTQDKGEQLFQDDAGRSPSADTAPEPSDAHPLSLLALGLSSSPVAMPSHPVPLTASPELSHKPDASIEGADISFRPNFDSPDTLVAPESGASVNSPTASPTSERTDSSTTPVIFRASNGLPTYFQDSVETLVGPSTLLFGNPRAAPTMDDVHLRRFVLSVPVLIENCPRIAQKFEEAGLKDGKRPELVFPNTHPRTFSTFVEFVRSGIYHPISTGKPGLGAIQDNILCWQLGKRVGCMRFSRAALQRLYDHCDPTSRKDLRLLTGNLGEHTSLVEFIVLNTAIGSPIRRLYFDVLASLVTKEKAEQLAYYQGDEDSHTVSGQAKWEDFAKAMWENADIENENRARIFKPIEAYFGFGNSAQYSRDWPPPARDLANFGEGASENHSTTKRARDSSTPVVANRETKRRCKNMPGVPSGHEGLLKKHLSNNIEQSVKNALTNVAGPRLGSDEDDDKSDVVYCQSEQWTAVNYRKSEAKGYTWLYGVGATEVTVNGEKRAVLCVPRVASLHMGDVIDDNLSNSWVDIDPTVHRLTTRSTDRPEMSDEDLEKALNATQPANEADEAERRMICTVVFVDPATEKDLWGITMKERLE